MGIDFNSKFRVAELFAGVGGFRLGLEGKHFEFVFSNQWEPNETAQWASKIYNLRFDSEGHVNEDIHNVTNLVPEHDLLVGGFPCQDYSVARTISGEMGIEGEKGKLWTPIKSIIRDSKVRPKMIFLENVPRLLNSPSKLRGLNFGVILDDLLTMGYDVEWRIIQASDYGMPQKRSRIFILAYRRQSKTNGKGTFGPNRRTRKSMISWMTGSSCNLKKESIGPFASSFPISCTFPLDKKEVPSVRSFNWSSKSRPFGNAGYAWKDSGKSSKRWMWTFNCIPSYSGPFTTLGDIIENNHEQDFEITDPEKLRMYSYIKGEQKEWRIRKSDKEIAESISTSSGNLWDLYQKCTKGYDSKLWNESRADSGYHEGVSKGIVYNYTAGSMSYPDLLDNPSRTVVTAEIGRSVSRMRHIIEFKKGKFRRLMPIELERLNMFPDNWTEYEGISDSRRGFLMGNALVVGVVERLAEPISRILR